MAVEQLEKLTITEEDQVGEQQAINETTTPSSAPTTSNSTGQSAIPTVNVHQLRYNRGAGARVNPPSQPAGLGEWYYDTAGEGSAEQLAHISLGGQEEYGFLNVPRPTAGQVWELRQLLQGEGHDATRDFRLVWIPAPATETMATEAPAEEAVVEEAAIDAEDEQDTEFDATNGGVNDQTGDDKADYHSRLLSNGQHIVVDRSPARVGHPQPHKFHFYSLRRGRWLSRNAEEMASMNWNDKKQVDRLNRWRTQSFQRGQWGKKGASREEYTDEEREWVWNEWAEALKRQAQEFKIKDLVARFNQKFLPKRSYGAIHSLLRRVQKQFAKTEGKFQPLLGRSLAAKLQKRKRKSPRRPASEERAGDGSEEASSGEKSSSPASSDNARPKKKPSKGGGEEG